MLKSTLMKEWKKMSQRVKDLEKALLACGKTKNENKLVPASRVPVPALPVPANCTPMAETPIGRYLSANVREMSSLEYFVDGLKEERDPDGCKNGRCPRSLKSSLKIVAAAQASCIDRHSI
ncbi:hypothetical protein TNCV_4477391 [Trichonephila clavipes]|nr:hypothetical protein TNCV_4477391 [Trichonephila clavipes]